MPLGSVSAYQAALESTNTSISYGMEAVWTTAPATTFQGMRILSESLAHKKTRIRPPEVRGDRQAAPGLTSQESASGNIVFPVYYADTANNRASQFDDFLSALLGNDWQAPTTISGTSGDITLQPSGGNALLSSTVALKMSPLGGGQIVKLSGFANATNNGFFRVLSNDGTVATVKPLGAAAVSETPTGANAKIYLSNLRNGTFFKTLFLQQKLDGTGAKWFRYPGAYPTKCSLTLSLGQFLQATFDMAPQQELKGLADASTGGVVAAPSTRTMDPVGGFKGVYWNDVLLPVGVNSCGFEITNEGAAGEFFLGNALATGMIGGTLTADAKLDIAFKDFTQYDLFRNETTGILSVRFGDQSGNLYIVSLLNGVMLFDSGVNNTGPNKMLTASITVEGSPDVNGLGTISIDRIPATA